MLKFVLYVALNMPNGSVSYVWEDFKTMDECKAGKKTAIEAVAAKHTSGFSIRSAECYPR